MCGGGDAQVVQTTSHSAISLSTIAHETAQLYERSKSASQSGPIRSGSPGAAAENARASSGYQAGFERVTCSIQAERVATPSRTTLSAAETLARGSVGVAGGDAAPIEASSSSVTRTLPLLIFSR